MSDGRMVVSEETGDRLYKIAMAFSKTWGIKIISKEDSSGQIYFQIEKGDLVPGTKKFVDGNLLKSVKGVSKDDFESMIAEMLTALEKISPDFEIAVEDYSQYSTLREQVSRGIEKGEMNLIVADHKRKKQGRKKKDIHESREITEENVVKAFKEALESEIDDDKIRELYQRRVKEGVTIEDFLESFREDPRVISATYDNGTFRIETIVGPTIFKTEKAGGEA